MSESSEWKPPVSFKWAVLTSDVLLLLFGAEPKEEGVEEEGEGVPWNRRKVLGPKVMVV